MGAAVHRVGHFQRRDQSHGQLLCAGISAALPAGGLPSYLEIPTERMRDPLRFAVRVAWSGARLKTTDADSALAQPRGHFRYDGLGQSGAITVASAAETYFLRPDPRADKK